MAITDDDEVYSWGQGETGRLGNGGISDAQTPALVDTFPEKVSSLVCGGDFNLAQLQSGDVYVWGSNHNYQLGVPLGFDVQNAMERFPTLLTTLKDKKIVKLIAGIDNALALAADGTVYSWGAKVWEIPHEMVSLKGVKCVDGACGKGTNAVISGKDYSNVLWFL